MKNSFLKIAVSTFASLSIMGSIPLYSNVYAEENGLSFKVSSTEEIVGNDVWIDVTSIGDVGFSSGRFCLHFNNEVLEYKGLDEGLMIPESSGINQDDISVTDDNQGITYIVFTVENINNADISFGFTTIAAGTSEMTLEVNELFDQNDEVVNYTVDNGSVIIKDRTETTTSTTSTETTTTTTSTETTTTTTSTETTTTSASTSTETTTATSSSSSLNSTSTETDTSGSDPSSETTTSATTESTESESSSQTSTQPTQSPSTSSNTQSTSPTISTAKTSSTTKTTTTAKPTTTTNNNNSGGADTGDRFPLAMLLAFTGVAGVAVVKTSPRKNGK